MLVWLGAVGLVLAQAGSTENHAGARDKATREKPQVQEKVANAGARGQSEREVLQSRFDKSSPAIGSTLPHATAYDADGNKLDLASLKGHWSVIVFGCLT